MTVEQLRRIIGQTPFQPFAVHLADGREISVPHRDFIWLPPGGRTFIVAHPDDTVEIVDLLLVTTLEVQSGEAKKNGRGNGKKKGGK